MPAGAQAYSLSSSDNSSGKPEGLVGLAKDNPPRTGLSSERADSGLFDEVRSIDLRNTTDRHLQLFLDLRLNLGATIPMSQCKAAMNLRLFWILRREVGVELFLGIDLDGVLLSEGQSTIEEVLLNLGEYVGKTHSQRIGREEFLLLRTFIPAGDCCTARL